MDGNKKNISRRNLIAGGASIVAGVVVARSVAADAVQHGAAFEHWTDETDVLVVGCGGAGLAAAIEAGRSGAKVLVLDKSPGFGGDTFRNGGMMAGHNTRLTKANKVNITSEQVWNLFQSTEEVFGTINPDVARIVAEKGGETIDWLDSLGVKFSDEVITDSNYTGDMKIVHQVIGGGRGFAEPLMSAAKEMGAQILNETRAIKLIVNESGRVIGVIAQSKGGERHIKARKAVILATGGYAANRAMNEFANPALANIGSIGSSNSTGDGLVMATGVGAIPVRISYPPLTYPTVEVEANNIFQWHTMQGGGIVVGEDSKRFVSEDTLYINGDLTKALLKQISAQEAPYIWMIVNDSSHLKHALQVHPVALIKADTIEELAEKSGLNSSSLRATVQRYNRFCSEKKDDDFGRKENLIPLDKGPFYLGKVRPQVVITTGGVKIDKNARVLGFEEVGESNKQPRVIPGLYAAGQVAEWSAIGGWTVSSAFTMGRIAGREAAAENA